MADGDRHRQLPIDDPDVAAVSAAWHEPAAKVRPARSQPPTTVILAPGAGSTLDAPVLVAVADLVARVGHRAVRVNLPFRQRRPTGPPPRAEASVDGWAAIRRAVAAARPGPVVVGGASYGGRVASMLVARDRTAPDAATAATAGLLCLSYPLRPPRRPSVVRADHLADIAVPMMVVQGDADPFGGPDDLAPHLAAVAAPVQVVSVQGGDHALHVARTRSVDGATHRVGEVVAGLTDVLATWLDDIERRAG